jgi:hypothetical protein
MHLPVSFVDVLSTMHVTLTHSGWVVSLSEYTQWILMKLGIGVLP